MHRRHAIIPTNECQVSVTGMKCPICHKGMKVLEGNLFHCEFHGKFGRAYIVGFWTGWWSHKAAVSQSEEYQVLMDNGELVPNEQV